MNTPDHVTFAVRVLPAHKREQWQVEVVNLQNGRRADIRSSRELGQFMHEEIDLLATPEDTQWTQIIGAVGRAAEAAQLDEARGA
jgi:hypothetical protein